MLYDRLRADAPFMARVAAAVGLLWSVALVLSGMVFTYGMTTVEALARTDRAQAALAWQAIEPVALGLGGAGGELLGGLWVLLVSWVVLRGGALPKAFGWFGVVIGVVGLDLGRAAAARRRHRLRAAADRVVRVARPGSDEDERGGDRAELGRAGERRVGGAAERRAA